MPPPSGGCHVGAHGLSCPADRVIRPDPVARHVRPQAGDEAATGLVHERPLLLILGLIALAAGLALVLTHNVWSGGAPAAVVTLVGWVILVRGVVLLVLPPDAVARLFDMVRFAELFYLYAGITLLLGLYLTWAGFRQRT
jgi:vacuolar-type H+-ATPase subunit I/STV1